MKSWEQKSLGDILTFQRGFDITKNEQTEGVVPIVSSSGITSYHNKFKVNGPGVVTGRKGTLGKVHFIRENFWPHDTTLWIKDFKGNDKKFLYYFLNLMQLQNYDVGASNPTLNRNHIHKIKLFCPPLPTQKKIAAVLSAYDDLIENNTRRIALLERMAEELYKEWFVRMRFPEHAQTRFVKGIPEGWIKIPLDDLCKEIRAGVKIKTLPNGTKYIGLEHIPRKSIILNDWATIDSVQSDKLLFQKRDILFGKIRPYLHKVSLAHFDGACSSDTIVLRPKRNIYEGFVFLTVFSETFIELATAASKGTKMPRADWDFLKRLEVIIPSEDLLNQFQSIFNSHLNQAFCFTQKNQLLKQTRDRLLTRLISGKLSVEDRNIAFPPSMLEDEIVQEALAQMPEKSDVIIGAGK